jgi:UDP:flavonoid glycosyltransferase YjiC (YdhE family)
MVPLAQALVAAGHEVAFATAERFCRRVVEPAGFTAFAAGLSPIVAHERTLELLEEPDADAGEADVWRFGARMFAGVGAPAKVEDLVGAASEWGADLVVHDMTDFAAPVAAAHRGIPWVGHSFGALQPGEFWDLAGELVAPTWTVWGVEPGPRGGMFHHLYLDVCPPSFQADEITEVTVARPLRPVAFDNPEQAPLPPWVVELPAGPTVYVTLGTVVNHSPDVLERVVEGLADAPWNVIVTVGPDRDPGELGRLPANVHVERYLPQSLVLERCQLVVCHAGSGTTLAALALGLPLLLLPQDANQFWNADRAEALGAGQTIRPDDLTPAAVRQAVARLLEEPGWRERAGAVASEIAVMPGPAEVVTTLVALVTSAREGPQDRSLG